MVSTNTGPLLVYQMSQPIHQSLMHQYHDSITVPCTPRTEGINPPKEISLHQQLASVDRLAAGWCSAVAGVGGRAVWNEVLITVRSHCSPAAVLRELNLGAVHLLVQDLHKQPSQTSHHNTRHLPLVSQTCPVSVKAN